ncbi:MAG: hypothetical protein K5896_04965 [Prevotella sp.]|nr:hypothetical protein [Prevotella sp.]
MKRLDFIAAALLTLAACQRQEVPATLPLSDADSIYTFTYISMNFVKEPEVVWVLSTPLR